MLKISVQFAKDEPFYNIPALGPENEPASLKDESNNTMLIMKAHKNYSELIVLDLNKVKAPQLNENIRAIDLFSLNPDNLKFETRVIKGEKYERVFKSKAGKGRLILEQV